MDSELVGYVYTVDKELDDAYGVVWLQLHSSRWL